MDDVVGVAEPLGQLYTRSENGLRVRPDATGEARHWMRSLTISESSAVRAKKEGETVKDKSGRAAKMANRRTSVVTRFKELKQRAAMSHPELVALLRGTSA